MDKTELQKLQVLYISHCFQLFETQVISGLKKVKEPSKTIFVACEEDMEEARFAVKKGIRTFSTDWLMNCVMTQELDLEAPQFAESL